MDNFETYILEDIINVSPLCKTTEALLLEWDLEELIPDFTSKLNILF